MNYDKALSLYRNDKTLQILRANHFPLLVSFFHLVFKAQNRISYTQSRLVSLLGDFIFSLDRQGIKEYPNAALDYLQDWVDRVICAGIMKRPMNPFMSCLQHQKMP
ncbi:hypothetical protein HDC92_001379 [Pedobacter sp. AK017]|nr:hypothetical protein [Pedobacter sp. AK017]